MPSSKHSEYYYHRNAHIPFPPGTYESQHRYSDTLSDATTPSSYTHTSTTASGSTSRQSRSCRRRLPSFGDLPPERVADKSRNCRQISEWIEHGMNIQNEKADGPCSYPQYDSVRHGGASSRSHGRGRSEGRRREKRGGACVIL